MSDDSPEIIIDEGWKNQVQRERELAQQNPQDSEEPEASPSPEAEGEAIAPEGLPTASFDALVGSLTTQTLFSLGAMAQPGEEQVMVNLDEAKFTLDLLEVLREKTSGNLSVEEEGHLKEALAELQRIYILRTQQFQEQAMMQAGIDPNNLKGAPQ